MSEIALWLFLLLLLIGATVFMSLRSHFRKTAEQELRNLGRAMRQAHSERQGFNNRARFYSLRDPEPYKSRSARLKETQSKLNRRIGELERRRVDLNERAVQLKKRNLQGLLASPFSWQRVRNEAIALQSEISDLLPELEHIAQMETELQKLPWLVGQQARLLQSQLQEISDILSRLEKSGLRGETFSSAVTSANQTRSETTDIPGLFFDFNETELIKEASKEAVARVHQTVCANQPVLDDLLQHLKIWETTASTSVSKVVEMRQAISEYEQMIPKMPSQLEIIDEQIALRQLEVIAQNLEASSGRMEIETIPLVFQEAERVRQSAQEQTSKLKRTISDLTALEALQSDLSTGFRDASLRLASLASRKAHPVRVDSSLEKLNRLKQQSNQIANGLAQRTIQQLSQDLGSLIDISTQNKDLIRQIEKLETTRADLSNLLESTEFQQLPKWIHETRAMGQGMSDYAPENWTRLDDISTFYQAVETFAGAAERFIIIDPSQPTSEHELDERLKMIAQLAQEYRRLANRADHFSARMNELHNLEQNAQETLEDQHKFLGQLRLIVKSNQSMAETALAEIDQHIKNIQRLSADLENPRRGTVEKKARLSFDLVARIEGAAYRWLDVLTRNCQEQLKSLSTALTQLDAIAQLEDANVAETRRLLVSEEARQCANPSRRGPGGSDELLLAFKRRSDLWQECEAARKSMENVHQLVETYHEADTLRQQTRQQIGNLAGSSPQKRAWPPTTVTFQAELAELEQLEREWRELHEHSGKAINMVAQYSNLGSRYKNLTGRSFQCADQRNKEQQTIEKLDDEIVELARPWEELQIQYQDNPGASQEMREMLANLDRALKDIERGYLRGELDYDEVVLEMKAIQRRVRYYQVALDDEHAVDASGRISRRR